MRLSREKVMRLSHVVTDVLVASDDVEFIEDRATIRQNVVDILLACSKKKSRWTRRCARRSLRRRRRFVEGSEEWDVLYRKYYAEEMRRMGIVHQTSRRFLLSISRVGSLRAISPSSA